jgi:ribosomal protein L37AE/L43A
VQALIQSQLRGVVMAGFGGMRKGRKEAADNLGFSEEGDCPRCGGKSQESTMNGYLQCSSCNHEWADPNHVEVRAPPPPPDHRRDSELIDEFKRDMENGQLAGLLGVDSNLTKEQELSLGRLEDKWMSGMQGHFNAAVEERKPLMINFDEDDNIVSTEVAALTIVSNGFDGGEEIRLEYPGKGTEFYSYNERSPTGWKRGRTSEDTARSITNVINRSSKLVYANLEGNRVSFELRENDLKAASLVLFVDDPGGTDIVAEKNGVILDARNVSDFEDYRTVVSLVLEDGIISPSEDQLLWAMRQQIGIDDAYHVQIVMELFGEKALKECTDCGKMAELYPEYASWFCHQCESWC